MYDSSHVSNSIFVLLRVNTLKSKLVSVDLEIDTELFDMGEDFPS